MGLVERVPQLLYELLRPLILGHYTLVLCHKLGLVLDQLLLLPSDFLYYLGLCRGLCPQFLHRLQRVRCEVGGLLSCALEGGSAAVSS